MGLNNEKNAKKYCIIVNYQFLSFEKIFKLGLPNISSGTRDKGSQQATWWKKG